MAEKYTSSPEQTSGEKYVSGSETQISFLTKEAPVEFEQLENVGAIQEYTGMRDKTFWERIGFGGSITARPIVYNDTIYFGACDKNFYAIDMQGRKRWIFATNGTIQSYAACENGRVYFGSGDKNLYCLESETGKLIWKFQSDGQLGGSPVLYKGAVYFGSADGSLYALDASTGKNIWIFRTPYPMLTPLIIDDRIYVGYEGSSLYCLTIKGELLWKYSANAWISSWPAVYDGQNIYFGSADKNLYSIKTNGYLNWKYSAPDVVFCPVYKGGMVYVGCANNNVYCISPDGKKIWEFAAEDGVSNITIEGEVVYFGSYDNNLYALEKHSGKLSWKFKTNGFVHSNPTVYKDFVIFGSWDCNLYCLNKMGKLLWKFQTSFSTPSKIEPPEETTTKKIELVLMPGTGKKEEKKYKAEKVMGNYEADVTQYVSGISKTYLSSEKRGYVGD